MVKEFNKMINQVIKNKNIFSGIPLIIDQSWLSVQSSSRTFCDEMKRPSTYLWDMLRFSLQDQRKLMIAWEYEYCLTLQQSTINIGTFEIGLGFCTNALCNQTLLSSLHLISQGWEAVIWVISQTMVWNDPLYTVLLLLFSFLPADITLVIYFITNDCWNYIYTIWKQVQIYVMCSCGSKEQSF